MPYTKKQWVDREIIEVDEMNHIEQGIADAHDVITSHVNGTSGVHGVLGRILGSGEIGVPNGLAGLNDFGAIDIESDDLPQYFFRSLGGFGGTLHAYTGLYGWSGVELLANAYYDSGVWRRFVTGKSALTFLMNPDSEEFGFWYAPPNGDEILDTDWQQIVGFDPSGNLEITGTLSANGISVTENINAGTGIAADTITAQTAFKALNQASMQLFKDELISVGLRASSSMLSSYLLTLPDADGSEGQALITDGAGQLSWGEAAGGEGALSAGNIDGGRADSTYSLDSLLIEGGGASE